MNNEPVAIRYDFDGYGYQYMDSGSGSDWQTRVEGEPLYTHPAYLTDDAVRYQWLRNEYAHGRETYLAEDMPSGEKLDEYIDEQLRKAQEK